MAPKTKQKIKEFSESTLQTLSEPITVNLRKIVGGRPMPIEIPPGPGEDIGGRGYSADMVRSFSSFISNEWTGGGMYDCTATGANGEEMHWEMFFPIVQVPELIPPNRPQAQSSSFQAPPAPQQAPPPQPSSVMNTSSYLSQSAQTYRQHPQQHPFAGQPAGGTAPAANPFGWQQGGWQGQYGQSQTPPARPDYPFDMGNMSATKEREERLKLEAKMERAAQQAQHDKEMAAMTAEMRRLSETVSKRPSDDESPALKAAMDKINALEQQSTTQVLMQSINAMQENTNRMFERMAADNDRKIEELRRAEEARRAAEPKSDPMMAMLMQMMQQQGSAQQQSMQTFVSFMQANQTQQLESARLAQANQMRPQEMLELFRAGNSGSEQMASAYGKAWELMANGVEQILHAQGPGVHPALAMLGQGVEGGLGMAQQYLEMKQTEATANAQARSIQSQMEAQTRIKTAEIQAQAAAAARAPYQQQTEPIVDGGEGDDDDEDQDTEGETEETEEQPVAAVASASQMEEREKQLFGEAHPHIMRLRKGVKLGAISPVQTAAALFQAIEQFGAAASRGAELPPVFALWSDERFADLIDALIPSAPAAFRDEAASAVYAGMENLKRQAGMAANPAGQPQPVG